jgi:hypothetical protein
MAVIVAAAMSATALAASSAHEPKTMVLQKADVPGGRLAKKIADKNPQVDSYSVEWRYKAGGNQLYVISVASVMSRGLASTTFRQARGLLQHGYRKINLPKYGDEQVAALAREDNAGELWVRKGGVVWALTVNTFGLESGLITKAEAIAQLKQLAPKQMKRVGRSG